MRVAALSDVHGNLPALEAVLRDVDAAGVDVIHFGGDVAAGPLPSETLDVLMGLGGRAQFIRGNADRELVAAYDGTREPEQAGPPPGLMEWMAERLTREHRDFLAELPETLSLEVEGLGPTLFCHGSPRTDMEVLTAKTPEERLREAVARVAEANVVCGHTHMKFERQADGKRVLNPGSVGLPYEGRPGAYWAVLGPGVEFRRTEYDVEATADLFRSTGYPDVEQFVTEFILSSNDPDETAEYFEKLARESPRLGGAPLT
jgi:putative phosphoesterase